MSVERRMSTATREPNVPTDKGHVVLIEDEKNIAALVRYNLRKEGFRVSIAGDGEEGLQLIERERPDVVLLDLLLPRVDGLEVCRRLKQREQTRSIPVIMLTAKAGEADKVTGLELGADDYVTKPFNPPELMARVRTHLELKHSRDVIVRCGNELQQLVGERSRWGVPSAQGVLRVKASVWGSRKRRRAAARGGRRT